MSVTSSNPETALKAAADQAAIDRHRGRFVPWIIAAFYLTFMSALIGFVFIAYAHPPSEVTSEPYDKGLAYNDTLAKAASEQALGWLSTTKYEGGQIVFVLRDGKHQPIDDAQVKAWFVHPDNHDFDRSFDLRDNGKGVYRAAAPLPDHGQWAVHVTAAVGGDQYQSLTTITVE